MQRIIIIPSDLMTTDDSLSNSVITKKTAYLLNYSVTQNNSNDRVLQKYKKNILHCCSWITDQNCKKKSPKSWHCYNNKK